MGNFIAGDSDIGWAAQSPIVCRSNLDADAVRELDRVSNAIGERLARSSLLRRMPST